MTQEPPEARHERIRRRFLISDAIAANYLAALAENLGDASYANALRDIRDRKLNECTTVPPPKDTPI
jgi:hypothetical protein